MHMWNGEKIPFRILPLTLIATILCFIFLSFTGIFDVYIICFCFFFVCLILKLSQLKLVTMGFGLKSNAIPLSTDWNIANFPCFRLLFPLVFFSSHLLFNELLFLCNKSTCNCWILFSCLRGRTVCHYGGLFCHFSIILKLSNISLIMVLFILLLWLFQMKTKWLFNKNMKNQILTLATGDGTWYSCLFVIWIKFQSSRDVCFGRGHSLNRRFNWFQNDGERLDLHQFPLDHSQSADI